MLGFKPQALNYSAQAEAALRKLAPRSVANGNSEEAAIMVWMADRIRDAVHFAMPEDGRIFADKLKGIEGVAAHLPYPAITLEYYANDDPGVEADGKPLYKATRRVLLALELSFDELLALAHKLWTVRPPAAFINKIPDLYRDGVIFVTGIFYLNYEAPVWSPCYAGWLLPVKGWDVLTGANKIEPLRTPRETSRGITGRPFQLFMRTYMKMIDRLGQEMTDRYVANDIGVESGVVLELIEALSCRNVKVGTLQYVKPNVNARRIRDGKLPLYETKVLTVDISARKPGESRGPLTDARNSPGEHLRRGHIQSYNTKDGKVNLWKQSQLVSVGNPRVIKKTYRLKKEV